MTIRDEFPYPLATTEWLQERLSDSDLKIVDASWRMPGVAPAFADHQKRRLPGAFFFDLDLIADRTTTLPHMLPSRDEFARVVGALGVAATDRVIVYDDAGVFSAARVWWTFRAMGHEEVAVLDGGLPKWLKEGRPTEQGVARPAPATYQPHAAKPIVRDAADVRAFLSGEAGVLLDARPAPRFQGEAAEPRPNLRRGHMPGAVNLPHTDLLTPGGELRPAAELARLFRERGVHGETHVITSCGSGVTAAVLALALERLGHRRHGLYDGSWTEWGREANDPALFPVATGG